MSQSKTVADVSTEAGADSASAIDDETTDTERNPTMWSDITDALTGDTASSDGDTTATDDTVPQSSEADTVADNTAAAAADAPLPLDQVFGILKNQRRRRVLQMLQHADDKVSLSDLAEQIAAWENDKEVKQITSSERKRVYVGLYQCHLPKMDAMGVIDFNKPRGTVELGDNMEAMYKYLETTDGDGEPDWHRYSMFLSVGAAAALGFTLLVRPMTALPVVDFAVVGLLVAFLLYGIVCLNWTRRGS